ncbi:MAG: metallophosphoesterase [Candidatus Hodarchaeota archaeon]
MKILLSADFHSDFTRLFQVAKEVDLCICCGDIFDYHELPTKDFSFPLPFYSIKGNKEVWGGKRLHDALSECHNFFWLNQHQEELEKLTGLHFLGIDYINEPLSIPDEIDVLIAHQPAFGLADQCSDRYHAKMINHCGSKAIRKLVDLYKPEYIVAGHVHFFQKHQAGKTLALTLSPALNGPLLMIIEKKLVFR